MAKLFSIDLVHTADYAQYNDSGMGDYVIPASDCNEGRTLFLCEKGIDELFHINKAKKISVVLSDEPVMHSYKIVAVRGYTVCLETKKGNLTYDLHEFCYRMLRCQNMKHPVLYVYIQEYV